MSPVVQAKKQSAAAPKAKQSQLSSSLQTRGMSAESIQGQDDIDSITGEPGKGAMDKVQSFARNSAKVFFQRMGASVKKDAPSGQKSMK